MRLFFYRLSIPGYEKGLMYELMSATHKAKGRLLYYYPVEKSDNMDDLDNWIGWHNDRYNTIKSGFSAIFL